jgi:hypothetical protein
MCRCCAAGNFEESGLDLRDKGGILVEFQDSSFAACVTFATFMKDRRTAISGDQEENLPWMEDTCCFGPISSRNFL